MCSVRDAPVSRDTLVSGLGLLYMTCGQWLHGRAMSIVVAAIIVRRRSRSWALAFRKHRRGDKAEAGSR